jgi:hypothetical protein
VVASRGKDDMAGRLRVGCLVVLAALLLAGCSGVLFASKHEDGKEARVKIDGGESWDTFDDKPRYPFDKRKTNDEMSIMLKSESTF